MNQNFPSFSTPNPSIGICGCVKYLIAGQRYTDSSGRVAISAETSRLSARASAFSSSSISLRDQL
jgi:hypothetical protein